MVGDGSKRLGRGAGAESDGLTVVAAGRHRRLERAGTTTIEALVKEIYADVPEALHVMAGFSVWAHLRKLVDDGKATGDALDGEWVAT